MFDYFRKIEPVTRVGHAMFVYDVKPHPSAEWVAQCTDPVAPLPPDVAAEGLGRENLRLAHFDCSKSWLYPSGNGWYVLARDREASATSRMPTMRARLAYEQTRTGFVPPFQVYEWFGQDPLEDLESEPIHAAPSAWPPGQVETEGVMVTPPVRMGEGLEFLGHVAEDVEIRLDSRMAIQTYWRVTQAPASPLSLMAHLLDANGTPVAVGDGLDVPIDQWQPNDVIVQLHLFEIPPATPLGLYWIQVGAYTLPDVQRLPVYANVETKPGSRGGAAVGDRLIIGHAEVIAP
jgi:hypothetical protein